MEASENTYILQGAKATSSSAPFTISKPEEQTQSELSPEDTKQLIDSATNRNIATSNLHETGFNYVNSIIGSGVIGIPYALRRAGFGLGVILLIAIAVFTDYSLCVLIKAGNLAGVSTYQDLVEAAFGKWGFYLLTVIQFIYPFIAMISYNVIIGDTATKVFRRVLGEIEFDGFVLFEFIASPFTEDAFSFTSDGITEAIGIIAFAYMCHHNSFLLYESLENPTQTRWNRVTHISLAISCMIVLTFGIAGYVTFTGFSQGDLLENYCLTDDLSNLIRLFFTITIMLTYPIECFVVREVLENALWAGKAPNTKSHNILLTAIIVASAFLLSTLTDCLGIVLELNGILAAVPLAYILPAATYLRLDHGRLFTWQNLPTFLLVLFGILVAICGTILAFFNVMNGVSCSHGVEMPYCSDSPSYPMLTLNQTKF
ncbi:amino acid transporter-like protein [Dinothrombium tinctorium]|uniref:Putative sodium-coupled neutral amino acid transporter 11 n=1 Tax=Dinothrombium tinctorium TaxID=1965070 RepID=A0A443RAF1_9ACAR|nr:amino acid transporter-like protein [Dinothrombium tinctorium]